MYSQKSTHSNHCGLPPSRGHRGSLLRLTLTLTSTLTLTLTLSPLTSAGFLPLTDVHSHTRTHAHTHTRTHTHSLTLSHTHSNHCGLPPSRRHHDKLLRLALTLTLFPLTSAGFLPLTDVYSHTRTRTRLGLGFRVRVRV